MLYQGLPAAQQAAGVGTVGSRLRGWPEVSQLYRLLLALRNLLVCNVRHGRMQAHGNNNTITMV